MSSVGTGSAGNPDPDPDCSSVLHEGGSMPDEVVDAKKARRRYTNRESARRVRARRNAEWLTLQQQLSSLTRQNQELSTRVNLLQGQKQHLLTHLIEVIARHRALSVENAALQQELADYQGVDPYVCMPSATNPALLTMPRLSSLPPADLAPKLPSPADIPQFDDMTWVDVLNAAESCRQGLPTPFSGLGSEAAKQQQTLLACMDAYSGLLPASGMDAQGLGDFGTGKLDSGRLLGLHPAVRHDLASGGF